ncbi:MAG: hypothetical protein ACR2HJ_00835 [Fimbriimonadales bacterium]
MELRCCDAGAIEELTYPDQFIDPLDSANEGLYGVNLTYRFILVNNFTNSRDAWVFLRALNTGEPYFGAGSISSQGSYPDRGVPIIAHEVADSPNNFVHLTHVDPITVPQSSSTPIYVRVANGGAATMPFMILISTINVAIDD